MNLLSGKIFWITDDFSYQGKYRVLTKDHTSHVVTHVKHCVIDENMIRFSTEPYVDEDAKEIFAYTVNLLTGNKEYCYSGYASYENGERVDAEISCDLFSHKDKYMLYGKWIEDSLYHVWWAIIDKTNK